MDSSKTLIEDLQRQLNELKGRNIPLKVLRRRKMNVESDGGPAFLDSGATHPIGSNEVGDRVEAVADGKKI